MKDFLLFRSIKTPLSVRREAEQILGKATFNTDGHFDSILKGPFRECLIKPQQSSHINTFFHSHILPLLPPKLHSGKIWLNTHLLEMRPSTHIAPHKDQFCGDTIIVLSLGGATRTLCFSNNAKYSITDDSLYVMSGGSTRHSLEHSILPGSPGDPNRISIIWREALLLLKKDDY